MPKLKSTDIRKRRLRTPNSLLLTKYEQIALLSTVYSQTEIICKLGNEKRASYSTITTAMNYFKEIRKRQNDYEWSVLLNSNFRFKIQMVNWSNRNSEYSLIAPTEFNQYVVNKIIKHKNKPIEMRFEYMDYQFFDLSIISREDLFKMFHAVIWNGIIPQFKVRFDDINFMLGQDNSSIILLPVDKNQKETYNGNIVANKDNFILM